MLLFFWAMTVPAQVTLYTQDFSGGFPAGWSQGGTIWFIDDAYPSNNYGGASGGNYIGNVSILTEDNLYTGPVSTVGYTGITVQWGAWRNLLSGGPELYFSVDGGVSWTQVSFTDVPDDNFPVIEEDWNLVNGGTPIALPAAAENQPDLRFRFRMPSFSILVYLIDDFKVMGACPPLTIDCPDAIEVPNDLGICGAVVTFDDPDYSGGCGTLTLTQTAGQASGTEFPVGTTTNTFRVTDSQGNSAVCSFNVTVNDEEGPAITCVGDQTFNTDPGVCTYTVVGLGLDPFDISDNCGGTVSLENDYNDAASLDGAVFDKGTTTVVWTAEDGEGNTTTCSTVVTVQDKEKPKITAWPGNQTLDNDDDMCGAQVTIDPNEIVATDNCDDQADMTLEYRIQRRVNGSWVVTVGWTEGDPSGYFEVDTFQVQWRIKDTGGNTSGSKTTKIEVKDVQPPVIADMLDLEYTTSEDGLNLYDCAYTGTLPELVFGEEEDYWDNCSAEISWTVTFAGGATQSGTGQLPELVWPKGVSTVDYTVTDPAGLTDTDSRTVTVTDDEVPTIGACGATYIVTLKLVTLASGQKVYRGTLPQAKIKNTITDNCDNVADGSITVTFSQTIFTNQDWGTNTEWVKAVDSSGNPTQCNITVIVRYPLKSGETDLYAGLDGTVITPLDVEVYPNPTQGLLKANIRNLNNPKVAVEVYNLAGAIVLQREYTTEGMLDIDLSDQIDGMYLLRIIADSKDFMHRVVKR